MTDALLTEGDLDRDGPPDLRRLQAIATLAPELPPEWNRLWDQVVDWSTRYLELDAPALFVAHRRRGRELLRRQGTAKHPEPGHSGPTDGHTLSSWALRQAQAEVNRRRST